MAANNARTVRLLLLVFVGLLGLALVLTFSRQNPLPRAGSETATPPIPFVFPEVEAPSITRIEMQNQRDGRTIRLTKVPGDWLGEYGDGARFEVNLTRMPTVLQILATLRYNRIIESSDLEAFGLADGGWFVIRFEAGASYTLRIGGNNPDQTFSYVRRGDSGPVLLVDSEPLARLVHAAADLGVNSMP